MNEKSEKGKHFSVTLYLYTLIKVQNVCGFHKIGVKLRERRTRLDSCREDLLMMMMMSREHGCGIMSLCGDEYIIDPPHVY